MAESGELLPDLESLFAEELERRNAFDPVWDIAERENFVTLCQQVVTILQSGGKLLICGNGGSAAQAQHFAAEMVGRFKREREAMPAIALTVDTSALTAIGNDYGFNEVFRRQAEALMDEGDLLLGLSTSGESDNVIEALQWAGERGFATAALTGEGGGRMADVAALCVAVPSSATDLIQERHLVMLHILAAAAESALSDGS